MLDLIKKTVWTGIGLVALTKDKIEDLVGELVRKGELSEKEGKALVADLLKRSAQARQDLEARIDGLVRKSADKLNLATKEDITRLSARIERLEQELRESRG